MPDEDSQNESGDKPPVILDAEKRRFIETAETLKRVEGDIKSGNRLEEAEQTLRDIAASKGQPWPQYAALNLGSFLEQQGRTVEAADAFLAAASSPVDPIARAGIFDLGRNFQRRGMSDDAEHWFRVGADRHDLRSTVCLGDLLMNTKRQRAAEDVYRSAIGLDGVADFMAAARVNLAILLEARGETMEAEVLFRECLDVGQSTTRSAATAHLADLLNRRGDHVEAELHYRRALELAESGERAAVEVRLGKMLLLSGDRLEAARLFEEVIHSKSHDWTTEAMYQLGSIRYAEQNFAGAERLWKEVTTALGDDVEPYVLLRLGLVILEQGRADEAGGFLRRVLDAERSTSEDRGGAWLGIAAELALTNKIDEAREALEHAIASDAPPVALTAFQMIEELPEN